MIRCYLLPVENIDGTEKVTGSDLMHDALLRGADPAGFMLLIMDTTDSEHLALSAVAFKVRDATADEASQYVELVIPYPSDPTVVRAQELLMTSPAVITQAEIWELMRLFGRFHGLSF